MVVDRNYRERGLATRLLRESEHGLDDMYGIATSHAAACLALAKSYGRMQNNCLATPTGLSLTDSL